MKKILLLTIIGNYLMTPSRHPTLVVLKVFSSPSKMSSRTTPQTRGKKNLGEFINDELFTLFCIYFLIFSAEKFSETVRQVCGVGRSDSVC